MSNCSQVSYGKATLTNFIGKHLCRSFFFNKFSRLRLKKEPAQMFCYEFPQILQNTFFAKHLWVTYSAKYHFLFVTLQPQPQKRFPSTLVILNIFETNTVNCCRTALCGSSRQIVSFDWVYLLLRQQAKCPKCCWKKWDPALRHRGGWGGYSLAFSSSNFFLHRILKEEK